MESCERCDPIEVHSHSNWMGFPLSTGFLCSKYLKETILNFQDNLDLKSLEKLAVQSSMDCKLVVLTIKSYLWKAKKMTFSYIQLCIVFSYFWGSPKYFT